MSDQGEVIQLYLAQEQKLDSQRGELSEFRNELAEYSRRMAVLIRDAENTRNRLEEGVSKTAFKAWEAVGEMKASIEKLAGRLDKVDIVLDTQGKRQDRSDKFDDRVIYGILLALFTSGVVTVVAFLWNHRPPGT